MATPHAEVSSINDCVQVINLLLSEPQVIQHDQQQNVKNAQRSQKPSPEKFPEMQVITWRTEAIEASASLRSHLNWLCREMERCRLAGEAKCIVSFSEGLAQLTASRLVPVSTPDVTKSDESESIRVSTYDDMGLGCHAHATDRTASAIRNVIAAVCTAGVEFVLSSPNPTNPGGVALSQLSASASVVLADVSVTFSVSTSESSVLASPVGKLFLAEGKKRVLNQQEELTKLKDSELLKARISRSKSQALLQSDDGGSLATGTSLAIF
jgi:hypothetical protein